MELSKLSLPCSVSHPACVLILQPALENPHQDCSGQSWGPEGGLDPTTGLSRAGTFKSPCRWHSLSRLLNVHKEEMGGACSAFHEALWALPESMQVRRTQYPQRTGAPAAP